jgi:hypothetical protein
MRFFIRRAFGASSAWSDRAVLAVLSLVVAAIALVAPLSQAQATLRQFPNGRIAIDLGAAFTPSEKFSGFVDDSTGASFAVIELPAAAYDKLKTIPDSPEALANEGFSGTEKAELKGRKGPFVYLVGKQKTPAGEVTKFVLIFLESGVTGVIVVNVPQPAIDAGKYSREGIEAILASTTVRDAPADPTELFRFGYLGPFKEAFNHGGLTKAYNISGAQPHAGQNQLVKEPMLLVSSSVHGDAVNVKDQADKAFLQLGGMKEQHIDEEKPVTIGDLKGHQIIGEVTDAASGDKIAIRLVLLSGEPLGYFMLLGSVPAADRDKMMPEIEKVMASFELEK